MQIDIWIYLILIAKWSCILNNPNYWFTILDSINLFLFKAINSPKPFNKTDT